MFSFPSIPTFPQQPSPPQVNPYEQLRNILLASQFNGNVAGSFSQVPQGPATTNPVLNFSQLWQMWSAQHPQLHLPTPQVNTQYVPSNISSNIVYYPVNVRSGDQRRDRKKQENQSRKRKRSPEPVRRPYSPPVVHTNQCLEEPAFDTIVVDTNAMILSLEQIAGLKEFEYFTVIVPFTVVNELDNMKMQNKDPELRAKAKRAIAYLFEHTSNDAKWIQLQTRNQVFNVAHGGTAHGYKTNNDDRILDCAMYFQHAARRVVLLTEDKNLSLKARCNAIEAAPIRTLLAKLPSIRLWNDQKEQILSKRRKLSDDPEPESSKQSLAVTPSSSTSPVPAETHISQTINSLRPLSSTQPL